MGRLFHYWDDASKISKLIDSPLTEKFNPVLEINKQQLKMSPIFTRWLSLVV
ncbi:hypothetical protein FDUTEX481_02395 [Tolypothrix sp. PCC 7601]|nr:hypothetical protein FDUTEX481_02395 [Tolypothrix sp. PCC 7601]